jgi:CarD family transcriptional regulator
MTIQESAQKSSFDVGQYVIYPTHGIGQIAGFETQQLSDFTVELIVITFHRDKMSLRIPLPKAKASGLRPLSTCEDMQKVFDLLKIKPRGRKLSWSRRLQEYDQKINSGDPVAVAEVVREIFKDGVNSEMSYSERQVYQSALERLIQELAVIQNITEPQAVDMVEQLLKNG